MEVSDELKNSDGIPTVIREHDGEYSKVASEYDADAGEIEFKADKFSEYAIAYTAAAENTVATPKTGDENGIGGWMAMLLISMGALLMVMKRINTQ
jgi:LPXTG-motif cell wall-anchored protein